MQKPVLVVMAAGMGSRYGGLKQLDPVGPGGQLIIDYSLFDAHRAGFETVIFVIKPEIEAAFRAGIGDRIAKKMEVHYVFQQPDDLPQGYAVPEGRVKPWGTAQAVLAARELIDGPFAVINSDDYYGPHGFQEIYHYLVSHPDLESCYEYAMVGYLLQNTVTENGHVARGICQETPDGFLHSVVERTHIEKGETCPRYTEDGGNTWQELPGDTVVSMNLWGFTQPMVSELWSRLSTFLAQQVPQNPMKCEFYLPNAVNQQLEDGTARVRVLPCEEVWHGVTYREDLASVKDAIRALKAAGVYEERLWPD